MGRWRRFSIEFKRKVVEEVKGGLLSVNQAMRQYGIGSSLIYLWIDKYEQGQLENEPTKVDALENKIAELERKIGQQTIEIELLKKAKVKYRKKLSEKSSELFQKEVFARGAGS